MLEILVPICSKIVLTQYRVKMDQGEIVSYTPTKLGEIIKRIDQSKSYEIINYPQHALQQAIKMANQQDIILVTGSLYLVGEIKKAYTF